MHQKKFNWAINNNNNNENEETELLCVLDFCFFDSPKKVE